MDGAGHDSAAMNGQPKCRGGSKAEGAIRAMGSAKSSGRVLKRLGPAGQIFARIFLERGRDHSFGCVFRHVDAKGSPAVGQGQKL